MILTGNAIHEAVKNGTITIRPFLTDQLNPNSYNFRLFPELLKVTYRSQDVPGLAKVVIPDSGFVLEPGTLYLGATYEVIGSSTYIMTLLGRSSIGRLGLFLNKTADFGHVGSVSQWTLELSVVQPLRIYPKMRVGQIAFWLQSGLSSGYRGRYYGDLGPIPNRDRSLGW